MSHVGQRMVLVALIVATAACSGSEATSETTVQSGDPSVSSAAAPAIANSDGVPSPKATPPTKCPEVFGVPVYIERSDADLLDEDPTSFALNCVYDDVEGMTVSVKYRDPGDPTNVEALAAELEQYGKTVDRQPELSPAILFYGTGTIGACTIESPLTQVSAIAGESGRTQQDACELAERVFAFVRFE